MRAPGRRSRRSRRKRSRLRNRMKVKTTKAAKFSDDKATSNNVSEAVSGDNIGAILKSCCDAISASINNTAAPSSQGVMRRDRVFLMLESSLSLTDCCNRFRSEEFLKVYHATYRKPDRWLASGVRASLPAKNAKDSQSLRACWSGRM